MNKKEIKEYEYDYELTNENKEALEKLRKEYGIHWFKMKLEDGNELNLVEKNEYDLLQQENEQLKRRIETSLKEIDELQQAIFGLEEVNVNWVYNDLQKIVDRLKGDSNE